LKYLQAALIRFKLNQISKRHTHTHIHTELITLRHSGRKHRFRRITCRLAFPS